MGLLLEAFVLVKNLGVVVSRIEPKLTQAFDRANIDLDLISMVLSAIPLYAEQNLGCRLGSLTFIEQVNLNNPKLFDLPSNPQMHPLGFGTSFRLGPLAKNPDYFSYIIDRVLLKNDDFLILGDDLQGKLAEIFYQENMEGIESFSGKVTSLRLSSHQGEFDKLFTECVTRERRGTSKFLFEPLLIYGCNHDLSGKVKFFADNPTGYELKHEILKQYFPETEARKTFFELIEAIHKLRTSLYRDQDFAHKEGLALFSFMKEKNIFLLVEYQAPNDETGTLKNNHLGMLLRLESNEKGINLSKLAYKSITILKASWDRFSQGGSVSFIDANLEKELKLLR